MSIVKYHKHPSMLAITEKWKNRKPFYFFYVTLEEVFKEIKLECFKRRPRNRYVYAKSIGNFVDFIFQSFSNMIITSIFPPALKVANIAPVFKTTSKNSKQIYRSVSILLNVSKILFNKANEYFEGLFSKYQCGFRQRLSPQYCLIAILPKWKKPVDKGKAFEALFTDLSKTFDCLRHELIIAKPKVYDFSFSSARLIHSYLFDIKQRAKINSVYSSRETNLLGVSQDSILGLILFNTFICDLFSVVSNIDFANYFNDNTTQFMSVCPLLT